MSLIIIGAGPAGMTAAIYAARTELHALLISYDIGGQRLPFKLTAARRGSANKYIRKEDRNGCFFLWE